MSGSPPSRPPSSHNSDFDVPALDPAEWKAPAMEGHDRIGFSPAPEQIEPSPVPLPVQLKSPSRANVLYTIPASPARTNATARLNEELNQAGGSVLDYGAIANEDPFQHPSQATSKVASLNGDASPNVVSLTLFATIFSEYF